MKIFVTAAAQLSPIGLNKSEVKTSFQTKTTGITKKDYGLMGSYYVGCIDKSDKELCEKYGIKGKLSRTSILGIAAVKEIQTQLEFLHTSDLKACLINGTSVGGMDYTESEFFNYLGNSSFNKRAFINHSCGSVTRQIMQNTFEFSMIDTVVTACSSSANAILSGANHLRAGNFDVAIVGGTDSLSNFTIKGFDSLMIYDSELCRPFDASRNGINLGEGAGFILLETERSMKISGNYPLVELSGWGSVSDAFHQTASSPEGKGATLAMKNALSKAGLKPSQIDFISSHGTATQNNDLTESIAIQNVFGSIIPPFCSTKAFTGHTLAASSGVEVVFSIYSMLDGFYMPNLGYVNPIDETGLVPVLDYVDGVEIEHLLSNAFGFGGNNTSLIFSKIK